MEEENKEYERAKQRMKKLRAFYSNLLTYVVINVLLVAVNLLTDPHDLWFYWVTVIWGLVLIVQAFNTFTLRNQFLGDEWEEKKIREIMEKNKRDRSS